MESYKNAIAQNLINGNYSLSAAQQKAQDKISSMVEYAWNNWDDEIVATYYEGEKPKFANTSFIENWMDNEDFEADGFDVDNLKALFGDEDFTSKAASHFTELYSEEIEAGEVSKDTIYEWWAQTKEQYPSVSYEEVESAILEAIN